jgi:uncharacterized protein (UPF0264 family)
MIQFIRSPESCERVSSIVGRMVKDAIDNNNMEIIYVICGSAHGDEVFDYLNREMVEKFVYVLKMSSTD